MSNSPEERIASSEWRVGKFRVAAPRLAATCYLSFASTNSFFAISISIFLFATPSSLPSVSIRPPPMRSVRSAGGARMPARAPVWRVVTDAQTPLSIGSRANPPCVHGAPRASPWSRSISQTGEPVCVRRLAFPATGRSPFGAPRGISGPGPCSPLLAAHQVLGGGAAFPPGSCAIRRTGHRYPEERVSRASPARPLAASGDTTASPALQERL